MKGMLMDFLTVYNKFHNPVKFSNGDRAEIRKVAEPEDLFTCPAFYKLLGNRLNKKNEKQWIRVVFLLVKGLKHKEVNLSHKDIHTESKDINSPALTSSNTEQMNKDKQQMESQRVNSSQQKRRLSIGEALANYKISEKRVFQVIRSESPNDLIQLRRLVIQAQPTVNFQGFAKQLWYWGKKSKKRFITRFFNGKIII